MFSSGFVFHFLDYFPCTEILGIHVMNLLISGRAWAATTTEGMLVYSLDQNLVFDPYDLEIEITPVNVKKTLDNKEYSTALILSFRLNENKLIQEVLESIPYSDSKWCL